jgi:ubiquinone biosynthesis protein
MIFDKTVKNITRIGEVINVLMKFGFVDIVSGTRLKKLASAKRTSSYYKDQSGYEYNRWERIRMVIEELGTTFIKLAQLLSNRPDILPDSLIKEFTKLQSDVPSFATSEAKNIIEKETGKKIDELFSYFDEKTIGAGSIGQVHHAKLLRGEDVAVKVQRPDARHKVRADLLLLREFVKLTENYFKKLGILNPLEIVDTFEESMNKELDYLHEAQNMTRFRNICAKDFDFYVPKPYRELSTSKVLIVEYTTGCRIDDIKQLQDWGINTLVIAEKLTSVIFKQIFSYGYFHADPHPGNILIQPDKQIVMIDHGMTGRLTAQQKRDFSGVAVAISQRKPKSLALNLKRLAVNSEIENMKTFEDELEMMLEDFAFSENGDSEMSNLIGRLRKIVFEYKLHIPGPLFMVLRTLAILESIGRELHPGFKPMEFLQPYGKKILAEQFRPENIKNELSYSSARIFSLLYSAPSDIKSILKKMRRGQLESNLKIKDFDQFLGKIDLAANRMSLALIISALFITSAIIMAVEPTNQIKIFGIPYLAFIVFSAAVFWCIWLIITIFKNRR